MTTKNAKPVAVKATIKKSPAAKAKAAAPAPAPSKKSNKPSKPTAKKTAKPKKPVKTKPEPFVHKSTVDAINEALESTKGNKMSLALLRNIIDSYHSHAADMVAQHGSYSMRGLVKLKAAHVKALPKREGKNPATGETVMLKARKESYKGKAIALVDLKNAALTYAKSQGCKGDK